MPNEGFFLISTDYKMYKILRITVVFAHVDIYLGTYNFILENKYLIIIL